MDNTNRSSARWPWWLPGSVIALSLAVLGTIVLTARHTVRQQVREQIAGRDAAVLHAVAVSRLNDEFADPLEVVLETSSVRGVMGVRLFDAQGRYQNAVGPTVSEAGLDALSLEQLRRLKPVSRYYPAAPLGDFVLPLSAVPGDLAKVVPLLEITIPLHGPQDPQATGFAQFIIEGHSLAAEFALLDQNLGRQAVATFAAGAVTLLLVLGWAFHRLHRANRLLAERTGNLLQANQELALAARTTAVGAVTAHLIHGLKNPLSGLESFVATRAGARKEASDTDWFHAVASTRRMQKLINDIVNVLREEQCQAQYEITVPELVETVVARMGALAKDLDVTLVTQVQASGDFSNRAANLIILILANLVQNALEATPPGKEVALKVFSGADQVVFEVADQGPGLALQMQRGLFNPCASTKEKGSGIGLAISKQLANHLGAALELKSSGPGGCVFTLAVPMNRGKSESRNARSTLGDSPVRSPG